MQTETDNQRHTDKIYANSGLFSGERAQNFARGSQLRAFYRHFSSLGPSRKVALLNIAEKTSQSKSRPTSRWLPKISTKNSAPKLQFPRN